ncbi:MAG: alanine--tRNA ligase [Phycisphaeraceae bacterium]|nr:alanine--tRNA ligase [Phycisphaeraceae bacterium]
MITSREIRQQYLDFFVKRHAHVFVPSSPVVPHDDPTLLFTNAGMNQFKPYFLGTQTAPWKRVANTQKCIRAGGKHNDLDDVGRSRRHHTFFEMLGNWSFGDYFKLGAIEMSWELLTQVWKLDPSRIHVTCFEGDEKNGVPRDTEAADIWKQVARLPDNHIHYFGKDNFWEMGDTGPCGPCTEIYYDRTPDKSGGPQVNGSDPRVMEIWNNVFIQYNRNPDRSLVTLPAQHVDTGMGFERICQVLQGKEDNFAIDLWEPFFRAIGEVSGHRYTGQFTATNSIDAAAEAANAQLRTDIAFRVIADHARCLTFALTDGAVPSNEGRGYVLRRILRRAVRFGRQQLGMRDPFMYRLVDTVAEAMGEAFPELRKNPGRVKDLIKDEEVSFGKTLDRGIELFDEAAKRGGTANTIAADDAFKLHDTYGFPVDLTRVMAEERGMTVDIAGFEKLMDEAKEQARAGGGTANIARESLVNIVQQDNPPATEFIGLDADSVKGTQARVETFVLTYRLEGEEYKRIDHATAGEQLAVVVARTPFYAEMGGQVGDTGIIINAGGGQLMVQDTIKVGGVFFHLGIVERGPFLATPVGDRRLQTLTLQVDPHRRARIMSNHTTTHVMNCAIRLHVSKTADQRGSLVDDQKLRFDYAHHAALTLDEIEAVEKTVNEDIARDLPVYHDVVPQEQALKIHGLRAVFGEKYPPRVRVVSIGVPVKDLVANPENVEWGGYSIEFCGGTHLAKTGEAEGFVLVQEEAVAKGVRRITALTGEMAHQAQARGDMLIARLGALRGLGASVEQAEALTRGVAELSSALANTQLPALVKARLREGIADLQKTLKELNKARSKEAAGDVVEAARKIAENTNGGVIVESLDGADADMLRTAMDVIRKKKPESALLLGSVSGGGEKVSFIAAVPEALIKKGLKAGDWVREVAKAAGGGGGGRPDMAQAGGKDPAKLDEALEVGRKFAAAKV